MPEDTQARSQRAYFPVARGLIEPQHHKAIASSVWVFLWVLRHQTTNRGDVQDSDVVTAAEIGTPFGFDDCTVRRHLSRLENAGYLTITMVPGKGYRLRVNKPLLVQREAPSPVVHTPGENARGATPTPGENARAPRAKTPAPSLVGSKTETDKKALALKTLTELQRRDGKPYGNADAINYAFGALFNSPHHAGLSAQKFAHTFHAAAARCTERHGMKLKATDLFLEFAMILTTGE